MVFLSGVDDIVGMPIPKAVPARIAKPVRASIRPGTPGKIAKPVLAKIAKPVKARIAPAYYKMVRNGVSGYHLSGLGSPDEIEGIRIDSAVPARIANPVLPGIAPGPDGFIPPAVQATIRPGPTGAIARGPGGDSDSAYGVPFSRTIAPTQITGPTAVLPAFPVPGAGEQAKTLSPLPIQKGPSGKIESFRQALQPDAKEALLSYVRARLAPLLDALAELPADERGPALREALTVLGQPNAETAIQRLSAEFIAKGAQPEIAFREALARVLSAAFTVVAPVQFLAAQNADNEGQSGLGGFWGDAWDGIKSVGKKVGKFAVKVVHKISDLQEDVACSTVGKAVASAAATAFTGAPPGTGGAAACASAKVTEYATAELAHTVGVKKKNPSFKSYLKSVGGEVVKGVSAGIAGAGGASALTSRIKLPANLQSISDEVRAKVENNKLMSITRKELADKVPSTKNLSTAQVDVVLTQLLDRAATPEAYGDKPSDTVLLGVRPKQNEFQRKMDEARRREAAKTPEDRAREKAEAARWWQEQGARYSSTSKNPIRPMTPIAPIAPLVPTKSSKVPLIAVGVVAVGVIAWVIAKNRKG